MKARSNTAAASEMYARHEAEISGYVGALGVVDGQSGAVFAINGQIVGMDVFDCPRTLAKLLPKLVRS